MIGHVIVLCCAILTVLCTRHHDMGHNLPDSQQAREIFSSADLNHDYHLSLDDLRKIFLDFDMNNDGVVTSDEWVTDWQRHGFQDSMKAVILFTRLDVDRDYGIRSADLPYIINFFDDNHDNTISQAEFVVQWIKMMNS